MPIQLCKRATIVLQVATIMVISGCQPQNKLINETASRYKPSDIRKIVMPLFSKYPYIDPFTNNIDTVVPFNEVPEALRSLPLFSGSHFIQSIYVTTNDNVLLFNTGSGFGHWGIAVCRSENDRECDKWGGYNYWGDGVYFYNGQ